jgi:hypothetical protein
MLKRLRTATGWRFVSTACNLALAAFSGSLLAARAFAADTTTRLVPVLAQATNTAAEPAAEGGGGTWPILDWLIVVALIGGALFAICRSSRRN